MNTTGLGAPCPHLLAAAVPAGVVGVSWRRNTRRQTYAEARAAYDDQQAPPPAVQDSSVPRWTDWRRSG